MPRVPEEVPQFSMNVPGAQIPYTREFGKVGEATQQLGSNVEAGGLSVYDKVTALQAQNDSSNAYAKFRLDSDQKIQDLKLKSPDGFMYNDPSNPTPETRLKNPDGTDRTMAREYYDWSNDRYQSDQEGMGTELAARMYRERALPHFSDELISLQHDTLAAKVNAWDTDYSSRVKASADAYSTQSFLTHDTYRGKDGQPHSSSTFDTGGLYMDAEDRHNEAFDPSAVGVVHNATQGQIKVKKAWEEQARAYTATMIADLADTKKSGATTQRQDVQAAFNLVQGTDLESQDRAAKGQPTLSSMLDPIRKEALAKQLTMQMGPAGALDRDNFTRQYEDLKTAELSGTYKPEDHEGMLRQIGLMASADPKHAAEYSQMFGGLVGANMFGQMNTESYRLLPESMRLQLANQTGLAARQAAHDMSQKLGLTYSDEMGSKASEAIASQALKVNQEIRDGKQHDLFGYLTKPSMEQQGETITNRSLLTSGARFHQINFANPADLQKPANIQAIRNTVNQYNSQVKTVEGEHPGNIRGPIDQENSAVIGATLKSVDGPNALSDLQAGQYARSLSTAYGNSYSKLMAQMVKDKTIDPEMAQLMTMHAQSSARGQTLVLRAIRGAVPANQWFEQTMVPQGKKLTDVATAVNTVAGGFLSGLSAANPQETASMVSGNRMQKILETATILQMKENGTQDMEAAAKTAYSTLIGNHVYTQKIGGGWSGIPAGSTYLPKNYNGNAIGDSQAATAAQNLTDWMKSVDKTPNLSYPTNKNGSPMSDTEKEGFRALINQSKRVAPATDPILGRGDQVRYQDSDGNWNTLMMKNAQGKDVPVFYPKHKQLEPQPSHPGVIDTIKSWLPHFEGGHQ